MKGFCQMSSKFVCDLIFAVNHEDSLWHLMHMPYPFCQVISVCMSADSRQIDDFCIDLYFFTEQLHFLSAMQQIISQCARNLIAYE